MRTTIDITDEQRARLLELAARRGVKGFSGIVQEALDEYLKRRGARASVLREALAARGALKGRAGEALAGGGRGRRGRWGWSWRAPTYSWTT